MKKRRVIRVILKGNDGATVNISGHTTSSVDEDAQKKKGIPVVMEYHPGEGVHYRFHDPKLKLDVSALMPMGRCDQIFYDPTEDGVQTK